MDELKGKVSVITGGSRGLGFSIAQAYAREGAAVAIGSRSSSSVERAVEAIKKEGGRVGGLPCDVGQFEQVQALAQYAVDEFGGLDVWVNNAGLSCPIGPTVHIPVDMVDPLIETNIRGVYYGSYVAMHHFLPRGKGKLINVLGRGYKSATPRFNPYGAAKSWVYYFTKGLVKEYEGTGVEILLYHPGLVKSDMMGHLTFVEGHVDQNMKVFQVIAPMFSLDPEVSASKAVWMASAQTDGKSGLMVNLLSPKIMLKGAFREGFRRLIKKPTPLMDIQITEVPAAISYPAKGDQTVKVEDLVNVDRQS
jgi:glucose 1-dehydrogenase